MTHIDWRYPLIFGADFQSIYKSLWLGWWLVTWHNGIDGATPRDICVSFQPGI